MSITKHVKAKLVNQFAEWGFEYKKDGPLWLFTRQRDGCEEVIQLDKGKWEQKGLRLIYYKAGMSIHSFALLKNSVIERYHYYLNEESLSQLMDTFIEITENYALDWFANSKPKSTFPEENYALDVWQQKTLAFIEEQGLEFSDEGIRKLNTFLKVNPNKEYFFCACRFIGDYIIEKFSGQWQVDPYGGSYIGNIGGTPTFKRSPHRMVEDALDTNDSTSLFDEIVIIRKLLD